jgi:hypothetical protein
MGMTTSVAIAVVIPVLMAVITCVSSVVSLRYGLRHKGRPGLTRPGILVLCGNIAIATAAICLAATAFLDSQAERRRRKVVEEWGRVPISSLTLGVRFNPKVLKDPELSAHLRDRKITLEITLDFGNRAAEAEIHFPDGHKPSESTVRTLLRDTLGILPPRWAT